MHGALCALPFVGSVALGRLLLGPSVASSVSGDGDCDAPSRRSLWANVGTVHPQCMAYSRSLIDVSYYCLLVTESPQVAGLADERGQP